MITPSYSLTATERVLPRLVLDFTTGTLDSRVTVTRALNTATRFNSSGAIEIVNANLPRFDYDPVTLLPKGLLIEELRANALTYSNDFGNAAWSKLTGGSGITPVVTSGFTDPSGGSTAWRIQLDAGPNGASDYSLLRQSVGALATPFTRSFWAKSNTGSPQTITLVAPNSDFKVTIPTTWTRLQQLQPVAGAGQLDFSVGGAGATPATADILIWNAQVETGSFATSYIPTTTTSLTRNADDVSMTGTNFSSWFNATQGTFSSQFIINAKNSATQVNAIFCSSALSGTNRITVFGGSSTYSSRVVETGNITSIDAGTVSANQVQSVALAYKQNSFALSANAVTPGTSASGNIPAYVDRLVIGNLSYLGTTQGYQLNGCMQKIKYWPQRLINAEVQAFSK